MKQTDKLIEKALRIWKVQLSLHNCIDLDIKFYNQRERRIERILKKLDHYGKEYRQIFIDRIYF